MDIRAHHLLCMKYFKGNGYNKEFVSNFYKVMKKLKDNPLIKVVDYPDAICNPCPHNINNRCVKKGPDFESEVREKDNIIMEQLGIKANQKLMLKKIGKLINLRLGKLRVICKDCEWRGYCD